jgi:hypothetical protein
MAKAKKKGRPASLKGARVDRASPETASGDGRPKRGRPKKKIDPAAVMKLAALHCTHREMADFFEVSPATMESRLQQPKYRKALDAGIADFKISIRHKQRELMEQGNVAMCIWLGKQQLGQRNTLELTGAEGGPIQHKEVRELTDDELRDEIGRTQAEIDELLRKTGLAKVLGETAQAGITAARGGSTGAGTDSDVGSGE